jgi:transketolase
MTATGTTPATSERDTLAANAIRVLSAEGVQAANSGHPGLPMGAADVAHVLWIRFLRTTPEDPGWINRDRFVLSAGHGSMLVYSLLHLAGFDMPLEELKNFRQWQSRTPGHPEYGHTPGVDMTAGPLGAGFASAVGMAIAEQMLAAEYNTRKHTLIDHFTYTLAGDGCMMEGVTSEAASLAGHLKLGKLIAFYDDNEISIEGSTNLAFTEDVNARFEAYGWHVQDIDGHDHAAIDAAIRAAQEQTGRPSLIVCHTTIGRGAPHLAGSHKVHGAPLGEDEIAAMKEALGWPEAPFHVPEEVYQLWTERREQCKKVRAEWEARYTAWKSEFSGKAKEFERRMRREVPKSIRRAVEPFEAGTKDATRSTAGKVANMLSKRLPELIGGSADLAPSTKNELTDQGYFSPETPEGRNIHFGVREHAMGSIANGLSLHGAFIPFCATFLVFADYMRPPVRLAALMNQGTIFYFTHDSIFVGEDGPTHQPVEQIPSLRVIPNTWVLRPCDANEAAECFCMAVERRHGPSVLALSRQKLPELDRETCAPAKNASKGGYILKDAPGGKPDVLLIATGSEVHVALEAYDKLVELGREPRVVSIPCLECFQEQKASYQSRVLPKRVKNRVVIEATSEPQWRYYAGDKGVIVRMETFGASAPSDKLAEVYGFTADGVLNRMREAGMID